MWELTPAYRSHEDTTGETTPERTKGLPGQRPKAPGSSNLLDSHPDRRCRRRPALLGPRTGRGVPTKINGSVPGEKTSKGIFLT